MYKYKPGKIYYHLLFWTFVYVLWVVLFRSYSVSITQTMTIEFCYLIFITADFYAVWNFSMPRFLLKEKYLLFIVVTGLLISVSAWLRTLLALQMNSHFFHVPGLNNFKALYFNSFLNISLWVLLITLAKMLTDRIQTRRQLELSEKERVKSELDFLKAQINPHALFNSLNTIYGHIEKNNQSARNILLQFSELLRYQLYDCGVEKVALGQEIDYIKNYIAFQRLRNDEKLMVQTSIENTNAGLPIAPLLLIILIENAFKFVSKSSDKENKICIHIKTEGNLLKSTFCNTIDFNPADTIDNSSGIGIRNLKRRLELVYFNKYELKTNISDNSYETQLNIDLS